MIDDDPPQRYCPLSSRIIHGVTRSAHYLVHTAHGAAINCGLGYKSKSGRYLRNGTYLPIGTT
jgi:hypothetical protein